MGPETSGPDPSCRHFVLRGRETGEVTGGGSGGRSQEARRRSLTSGRQRRNLKLKTMAVDEEEGGKGGSALRGHREGGSETNPHSTQRGVHTEGNAAFVGLEAVPEAEPGNCEEKSNNLRRWKGLDHRKCVLEAVPEADPGNCRRTTEYHKLCKLSEGSTTDLFSGRVFEGEKRRSPDSLSRMGGPAGP